MPEETKHDLPPTYQLHTKGKRITVSYLSNGLRHYLDTYWLQENKARDAAWAHYRNLKKGLTSVE